MYNNYYPNFTTLFIITLIFFLGDLYSFVPSTNIQVCPCHQLSILDRGFKIIIPQSPITNSNCQSHIAFGAELSSEDEADIDQIDFDTIEKLEDEFQLLIGAEVMKYKVTSVSKKEQKVSDTASAIFVITQEDIRRSGVTSIPEAIRIVPGLQVAQVTSNIWAISMRGFNSFFVNKLLVLIDGRNVYTPMFSGVYWDVQNTLLKDVERIEVVRGPGSTIWGTNAVNGVINIITKKAKDTQGSLVIAGYGTEERGVGSLRYGGKISNNAYYRVYANYFNRDDLIDLSDDRAADEWDNLQGGFRVDWYVSDDDSLTLHGDIYNGHSGQTLTLSTPTLQTFDDTINVAGGNVLTRWKHTFSDTSDMITQLYYDRTERDDTLQDQIHNTIDMDLHHRFALGERQEIHWGIGYRFIGDEIEDNSLSSKFDPGIRSNHIFSVFLQDEITILPSQLRLTLGSKFEHNDYTGFEVQPSARLLWTSAERHTVWAAVSRAVRTPSRADNDHSSIVTIPGSDGPDIVRSVLGNRDLESENLLANEIGYRTQMFDRLFVDITAFYNIYDDLLTIEPGVSIFSTDPAGQSFLSRIMNNKMDGETYGLEIFANYRITDRWKLAMGYTYLHEDLQLDKSSKDTFSESSERNDPHHQFQLRSNLDLPYDLEFDTSLYYVDVLPKQDVSSYIRLDSRFGWHPTENLEVSISLQNLLEPEHHEFGTPGFNPSQVQRAVYGQITWSF